MILLNSCGMGKASVTMQDRLRKTGRTGAEIDCTEIVIRKRDVRACAGIIACDETVIFCERRALLTYIDKCTVLVECRLDILDTGDELRTEEEDIQFCQVRAVEDLIRCVAEVKRNCERAGLQDTEVDREPLEAVHHEDTDLVALLYTSGQKHIGQTVCLLIEDLPCDLAAVSLCLCGLDQFKFFPCDAAGLLLFRIEFNQCDLITVEICISL